MSHVVDIPGGQATLRDAKEVKQRDRRRLEAAAVAAAPALAKFPKDRDPRNLNITDLGLTPDEFGALYDLQDATILAYLKDWTLPLPLPQDADALGDLESDVYDALRSATAPAGAEAVVTDFSPSPDPTAPTVGSGDSVPPSTDGGESRSTEMSPSTGANTATAS